MPLNDRPEVLIVDDEIELLPVYSDFLADEYSVRTANSGEEALDELDDSLDVVLLDRRMPGISGDEILDHITERGYNCRVAMVTAVEPDFDIIEMGFDDYLVKPVDKGELNNLVDSLLHWDTYDTILQEYFTTASKISLLESQKTEGELTTNEEYTHLKDRLTELQQKADEELAGLREEAEVGNIVQHLTLREEYDSEGKCSITASKEEL